MWKLWQGSGEQGTPGSLILLCSPVSPSALQSPHQCPSSRESWQPAHQDWKTVCWGSSPGTQKTPALGRCIASLTFSKGPLTPKRFIILNLAPDYQQSPRGQKRTGSDLESGPLSPNTPRQESSTGVTGGFALLISKLCLRKLPRHKGALRSTGQRKRETGRRLEDLGLELNSQSWVKVCTPLREKLFG